MNPGSAFHFSKGRFNAMTADLLFVDHGGALWLLSPITPAGQAWISANVSGARRWGADSFVIAPWDVEHYANRAASDGLGTRMR
jgi:hypothetical protein